MTDEERNSMREHIVWLTLQLDKERSKVKLRDALLEEMINPDELGHAVTQEIRGRIYSILYLSENK